MRRKTILMTLGLLLLVAVITLGVLYALLRHEPGFYKAGCMPPGETRTALSREFVNRFYTNLMNSVYNRYPEWWEVFTTEMVNSYLQEDFINSFGGDANLPDHFHDLRIQIEEGRLRLGCRYENGLISTILSIEVKMWLVANEVNLIGVEVLNLRAGALPISRQLILDYITEIAHRSNIDVKWYRHNGNPVAILKLQADQVRPSILLQRFELQQGKIIIVGRSTESQAGVAITRSAER